MYNVECRHITAINGIFSDKVEYTIIGPGLNGIHPYCSVKEHAVTLVALLQLAYNEGMNRASKYITTDRDAFDIDVKAGKF